MAISFVGSTADALGAETTTTTFTYTGVAAGRFAILYAVCRPNTATFNTVSGWNSIVNLVGGTGHSTGVGAADAGQSRLGVWYRILDGSEDTGGGVGSITLTLTGGDATLGSIAGGVVVYDSDLWGFGMLNVTTGSDNLHADGRTMVCAAWTGGSAPGLQTGDTVVRIFATDQNTGPVFATHTMSQSAATFGTVNERSIRRSTGGNDCGIYVQDCLVTGSSGPNNTNAPTIGFTTTVALTNCGPGAVIWMRDFNGGQIAVTLANDTAAITGATTTQMTLTPATLALSGQSVTSTPNPVEITLSTASVSASPQSLTVQPGPVGVELVFGSVAVSPQGATIELLAVVVSFVPTTIELSGQSLILVPGMTTAALIPATVSLDPQPLVSIPEPIVVGLQPTTVLLQPEAFSLLVGTGTVQLAPATLTVYAASPAYVGGEAVDADVTVIIHPSRTERGV